MERTGHLLSGLRDEYLHSRILFLFGSLNGLCQEEDDKLSERLSETFRFLAGRLVTNLSSSSSTFDSTFIPKPPFALALPSSITSIILWALFHHASLSPCS
jgi:hypothetical protein